MAAIESFIINDYIVKYYSIGIKPPIDRTMLKDAHPSAFSEIGLISDRVTKGRWYITKRHPSIDRNTMGRFLPTNRHPFITDVSVYFMSSKVWCPKDRSTFKMIKPTNSIRC